MKYEVYWNKVYADPRNVPCENDFDYDESRTVFDWTLEDMWKYAQEDSACYPLDLVYEGEDFDVAYKNYHEICRDCKTYTGNGAKGVNALLIYDVVAFLCDDRIIAWHIKPLKEEVR